MLLKWGGHPPNQPCEDGKAESWWCWWWWLNSMLLKWGGHPQNQPCEDGQAESWWWWWLNSMLLTWGGHPQINPVRTARRVVVVVVELNVAEVGRTFRPNQPREDGQAESWWWWLNSMLLKWGGHSAQINPVRKSRLSRGGVCRR